MKWKPNIATKMYVKRNQNEIMHLILQQKNMCKWNKMMHCLDIAVCVSDVQ